MPRKYKKVKAIEDSLFKKRNSGKTNQKIAEQYGLELEQKKNLVKRHNSRQVKIIRGEVVARKGIREKTDRSNTYRQKPKSRGLNWKMSSCRIFFALLEGREGVSKIPSNL